MKKTITIVLILIFTISVMAGCSGNNNVQESQTKTVKPTVEPTPQPVLNVAGQDDIVYTVTCKIEGIIGDVDENGEPQEGGEYFKHKMDIYKAEDFRNLIVTYTIKNDSQNAFGYRKEAWQFKSGETLLNNIGEYNGYIYNGIEAGKSITETQTILVENKVLVDKITVEYEHLNYSEEYWEDCLKTFGTREMSETDFYNKYTGTDLNFTVDIA